jgi:2'-5' RNA ligase
MKKRAIVYWLLPAKAERELFCEIIRILCDELNAPNFEPHLTLLVSDRNRERPRKILRDVKAGPVRLRVLGVAFSPKYTKTLFVRFKPTAALNQLVARVASLAGTAASALRDPHLSLLYKRKISAATERELARTLKLPIREVVFDVLAAATVKLPVKTRSDVAAWKIVGRKPLRR